MWHLIFKKEQRATVMFMMIFMMAGIFLVAFSAAYLVLLGVKISGVKNNSLKAFYAAESGREELMFAVNRSEFDLYSNCTSSMFAGDIASSTDTASYRVDCDNTNNPGALTFYGLSNGISRKIESPYINNLLLSFRFNTPFDETSPQVNDFSNRGTLLSEACMTIGATSSSDLLIAKNYNFGRFAEFNDNSIRCPIFNLPNKYFTFSTWVKVSDGSKQGLVKGIAGYEYNAIYIGSSDLYFSVLTDELSTTTLYTFPLGNTINDDTWHHYVLVYDNSNLTAYLDGQAVGASQTLTGYLIYPATQSSPSKLTLGDAPDVGGFHGYLDEMRFYDRALNVTEIGILASGKYLMY